MTVNRPWVTLLTGTRRARSCWVLTPASRSAVERPGCRGDLDVPVVVAAALAVKAAPAVLGAAAGLLRLVLIAVAVAAGIGVAGGVGLVAFQVRRGRLEMPRVVHRITPAPPEAPPPLPEPRPAIERAPEVHLHLQGVTAEEMAAILARRDGRWEFLQHTSHCCQPVIE